jgi:hypothetical protein
MKNLFIFSLLILGPCCKSFAQSSYLRTGYFQFWSSGEFTNKTRFVNEYSGQPGMGIVVRSDIDSMSVAGWKPWRREIAQNAESDSATVVHQFWNEGTAQYVDKERSIVIKHPVTNKVIKGRLEVWSGTAWVNSSLETYTYNASNHLQELVSSVWNGAWVNQTRKKYFTNANGWPLVTHHDSLVGVDWITNQMDSSTFDANGNRTKTISWAKNMFGVFFPTSEETATYNGTNQMVSTTLSMIMPGGNGLFPITLKTIEPGEDHCNNELVQFNSIPPPGDPIWANSNRIIWEPFSGIEETMENRMPVVFPNPLQGRCLHIKMGGLKAARCEIRDVTGRIIAEAAVKGESLEINTDDFPAGILRVLLLDGQNNFVSSHAISNIR